MPLLDIFVRHKPCRQLVPASGQLARKYASFKEFLDHNNSALNGIAELERMFHSGEPVGADRAREAFAGLMASVRALAASLRSLSGGAYADLARACDRIEAEVLEAFRPAPPASPELVLDLSGLGPELLPLAGAKATNLAVARNVLGLPTPDGFVVTANATRLFLDRNGLPGAVSRVLAGLDPESADGMEEVSRAITQMIHAAEIPPAIEQAVCEAYRRLAGRVGRPPRLAMRSSAVGEDADASFAGQYVTALNVAEEDLLEAWREVVASKYTPRAIAYRMRFGLDDADTPMCVAGIAMLDARASGVLYTADPAGRDARTVRVAAVLGLGELLVSGQASPDVFTLDADSLEIVSSDIARKTHRLVNDAGAGTRLVRTEAADMDLPAVDPGTVRTLARYGRRLEEHFGGPQDVEWAVDGRGDLYILQSRPLALADPDRSGPAADDARGFPLLLAAGRTASPGCATGPAYVAVGGRKAGDMPDGAILVVRTASPDHAVLVGRMRGLVTDIGSAASHLASVAREAGVPMVVDAGTATAVLPHGADVTLRASPPAVFAGRVPGLGGCGRRAGTRIADSPARNRLREALDRVSPLHLTDPAAPSFREDACRTVHDIVRFAHEKAMREMFGLSDDAASEASGAVRLHTDIPLALSVIDLGGGLRPGLTSCDKAGPEDLRSVPMRALWKGFSHPGITWKGTMSFDTSGFLGLLASSAAAETGGGMPGGDSYAIVAGRYLNLSAKFAYHYANIDAFCGDVPSQNYLYLRFSGGAGGYVGRSLRVAFMAGVLERVGCTVGLNGDLLDAQAAGLDAPSLCAALDQIGRLFASSRLLDMSITDPDQVGAMTERFFQGDYDFLGNAESCALPGFYTHTGTWSAAEEQGRTVWLQDGSARSSRISASLAGILGRMVGPRYRQILGNAEAYFPLAISKGAEAGDGTIRCRVRPVSGALGRTAGLAFGLTNVGNYFVLGIDALERSLALFEFVNNRRLTRAAVPAPVAAGAWAGLAVTVSGRRITGALDGKRMLDYEADRPVQGYVGLWARADSVSRFQGLEIEPAPAGTDRGGGNGAAQ